MREAVKTADDVHLRAPPASRPVLMRLVVRGSWLNESTSPRQHPFDDYALDFYCPSAKLAIELDGGGHNYHAGQIRDHTRSQFLARHGVIVLRFWNHQVRQELDSVLRAIWFALEEQQKNNPSPSSSPFGKGRGEV
jgi:very-short-patch-repair endonuclease